MTNRKVVVPIEGVERAILVVRGQKVILDADLAGLYGVSTKRLKEQVRRNKERFPADFMFLLDPQEVRNLRSQFATSSAAWEARVTHPWLLPSMARSWRRAFSTHRVPSKRVSTWCEHL